LPQTQPCQALQNSQILPRKNALPTRCRPVSISCRQDCHVDDNLGDSNVACSRQMGKRSARMARLLRACDKLPGRSRVLWRGDLASAPVSLCGKRRLQDRATLLDESVGVCGMAPTGRPGND
jgi:hypothetical protein